MASPTPFKIPTPKLATDVPEREYRARPKKDRGPNFFLEPIPPGTRGVKDGYPEGWLKLSYDVGKWFDCGPVEGSIELGTIMKGSRKGEPTERLTGFAVEIRRQLNEAAKLLSTGGLNIGVSIKYFQAVDSKGNELPGQMLIKYLGQNRKQRKPRETQSGDAS